MTRFGIVGACRDVLIWSSTNTGYLLGNVFGVYLYGALTLQLYRYYISFPKDPKRFKIVIYIVYVAETICTVVFVYDLSSIINTTIAGLENCSYDAQVALILVICGGLVAFLTQSMYAYRIRIITKLKYIPWVIILVMAAQLVAVVIIIFLPESVRLGDLVVVWTSLSLFIDVTITSIMIWFLKKDEILSKQLKRKITRLIYLIIGTGFLTAATNLYILVSLFWFPACTVGILIVLSKLYANSMMVLVNSRIPSARSEINHRATLDMITVCLSSFNTTSQVAVADAEHGQREISVDPTDARGVGLSAHEAENAPGNYDLDKLTV